MDALAPLRSLNRMLHYSLTQVVGDLSDEQLRYSAPAIDERPIQDVALHAYHSLLAFVMEVAGTPMPPEEWRVYLPATATKAELLAQLDAHRERVSEVLHRLPESALEQPAKMPWGQTEPGLRLLSGALAHSFTHAGNIAGIRAIGGFPTPPESY